VNEGRTTAIFGLIAAICLGLAWWTKPEAAVSEQTALTERVGQDVFEKFSDPESAASMQIIKYDETLAQLDRFEVARDPETKLWTLPSNDGYPADAADQVKDATTPLIGLKILSVMTDVASDHELYGVINPDDEKLAAGAAGVGMLVTFKDEGDQVLASLVIGKEVDQAEGQRFVRIPTEDAVYKVELDTAAFSTEFRDWIEGELLGVRSMDITQVGVRDYTLEQSLTQVTLKKNFNAQVSYSAVDAKWSLDEMTSFETGSPVDSQLAEGEELNEEFLNSLRTAVQDLTIVDVQRKPKGLAADLKADDSLLNDRESIASLQQQGFFAAAGPDGTEIFAAGGETIVGTDEGVEYLLRFGEATASLSSIEDGESDSGLSRYLLVTAKLNENRFPAPELEPLPETVEEMLAREKGDTEEASSLESGAAAELPELDPSDIPGATTEGDQSNADTEAEQETGAGEAAGSTEAATSEKSSDDGSSGDGESDGSSEADLDDCGMLQEDDEPQEGESQQNEEKAGEEESAAQESAPEKSSSEGVAASSTQEEVEPQETQEELEERLEAVREEIAKENQRKIDERNDKIDAARKKVLELNAKFSDWYYVVSDGVYEKLKITRDDLVKQAGEEEAATEDASASPLGGIPGIGDLQLRVHNASIMRVRAGMGLAIAE
jgi:hypothetical protein